MTAFVDCGAFRGKALNWARKRYGDKCSLYAFECNPRIPHSYGKDVKIIEKAVWVSDGNLRFYMNIKKPTIEGHSVYKNKTTGNLDKEHPVIVESIDFSNWLKKTFNEKDIVIVKMNIEGAEYDVLEKCVKDGTMTIIKELHIQWHSKKIPGLENRHRELLEQLNKIVSLKLFNGYGNLKVA
jgi:FkbM family methyltransferase